MEEKSKVVFVSGHLDLTKEEFFEHYVPRLHAAVEEGCAFVVGDAQGCDYMTQRWLWWEMAAGSRSRGDRCTVYHMSDRPRHSFNSGFGSHDPNVVASGRGFPLRGGYGTDEARDAAMTRASGIDIAWVRPGRSKRNSGTAKNLRRRAAQQADDRAVEIATWPCVVVEVDEIYPHYQARVVDPGAVEGERSSSIQRPLLRIPQELLDRMAAATAGYQKCQAEFARLLYEQGYDGVS